MSVNNLSAPSQFKLVSIGIVAENKSRTTDVVEVVLSETHPYIDGEINASVKSDTVSGTDANGNSQTFNVKMSNTVQAKWKGDGTNRISAPDVRRGDSVDIYQFGDHDGYFWSARTQLNNPNVRKRETVIHAFSNTTDESQGTLDASNAWFTEVNTHEKHVTLQTNKADGEPYAYTLQVDAKNGNFVVTDDVGNMIQVNSAEQHVTAKTSSGGSFEIIKKDIILNCDNFTLNASKAVTVNGQTATFTIPKTQWKGDLSITGNMASEGGTYTFNGNVVTTGQLMNNGKNVGDSHTHKNVKTGSDNSGGVN